MRLSTPFRPFYLAGRLRNWLYEKRHPDHPWLAPDAIRWLEDHFPEGGVGFEWGSGRSTLWFARRLQRLTSVEHDAAWYTQVRSQIEAAALSHVHLMHVPLEHPAAETYAFDYPVLPRYVTTIEKEPDASLDLVIVDGWYRPVCARLALGKLKPGGLLLIDNTDWKDPPHVHVPSEWPLVHQSRNVMTQTSVWRKPE